MAKKKPPKSIPLSWMIPATFVAGESSDPGDALGQLRPSDAILNREQKKKLALERDLPQKIVAGVIAALTATKEPPADKIPFAGTGPELANHIIQTHLQAIVK